jgi:hypothetical protein
MAGHMVEIKTISFLDAASGEQALAIVRVGPEGITLTLSLRRDGDVEVVLQPQDCEALITALEQANAMSASPNV